MDLTARGAYGFGGWSPSVPGGTAIAAETQVGVSGEISGISLGKMPFGPQNPLFWLLVLFLVFTGWMYASAEIGVKRVGSARVKAG